MRIDFVFYLFLFIFFNLGVSLKRKIFKENFDSKKKCQFLDELSKDLLTFLFVCFFVFLFFCFFLFVFSFFCLFLFFFIVILLFFIFFLWLVGIFWRMRRVDFKFEAVYLLNSLLIMMVRIMIAIMINIRTAHGNNDEHKTPPNSPDKKLVT